MKPGLFNKGNGGVRGVLGGGNTTGYNVIQYVTLSTQGNAVDFGDLTQNTYLSSCSSSRTRGCWNGGYTPSSYVDVIQYVTISSTANKADFGDLTTTRESFGGCSDVHGGLQE